MITYSFLQHYWWILISILGAVLVFMLFVQGGQSMLATTKDRSQRSLMVNSLGRKWELTFTSLVVFGGAFFASFPLFYSTSFGGAYWLWMLILFTFVVQAVSYKYRSKDGNVYGTDVYDIMLTINGIVAPVLLGVAVAMMFFGGEFTIAKNNILGPQAAAISQWSGLHGLEAILSLKNLSLGFTVLFLSRVLASLYFINNINDNDMRSKQKKELLINSVIFVPLFLIFISILLTSPGVKLHDDGTMVWEDYKYATNLIGMWWILATLVIGVVSVLFGILKTLLTSDFNKGIWFSGIGTALVVLALFWTVGNSGTAYYPSLIDVNNSLTIHNSSSSEFTLKAMSIVSLLIPFVIAYIVYVWRALDKVKITRHEIENTSKDEKY